jgi:hypothetical protein
MPTFLILASLTLAFSQQSGPSVDRGRSRLPVRPYTLGQSNRKATFATWAGVLVDAGCRDRPALTRQARAVFEQTGGSGVERTAGQGRGSESGASESVLNEDAMEHHNPQHLTREPGAGCQVTGGTRQFALMTPDGKWWELDPAGNTLANGALQQSVKARAMLSGKAAAPVYLRATVKGTTLGRSIRVERIRID